MKKIDAREKAIFLCNGKKCGKHSKELRKALKHTLKEQGLKKEILLNCMECTDNCKNAPIVCLQPHNIWLGEVADKDVPSIIAMLSK
ncbi:(2Fe-2S) ferredoxin domain-containing protein [Flavobacterium sp. MK4S-17]|uniref:(2Fe-2S) ferredoxin domain-containing protein n=1 Tax=Flavobacterium sp. MK4S-17 TaxID=2543737 RepID=UPI001359103A|nr:(2Fe-2S) ferredoxin domain-containing protein [Flavobacterium sp. MK4S-17]